MSPAEEISFRLYVDVVCHRFRLLTAFTMSTNPAFVLEGELLKLKTDFSFASSFYNTRCGDRYMVNNLIFFLLIVLFVVTFVNEQ